MTYEIKLSPVTNAETYEESWSAIDENGDEVDLTGATITFNVQDKCGSSVLSASTNDGITINTTVFTVRFEVSSLTGVDPKDYNVGCTILLDGDTTQFFRGTFTVLDGYMT